MRFVVLASVVWVFLTIPVASSASSRADQPEEVARQQEAMDGIMLSLRTTLRMDESTKPYVPAKNDILLILKARNDLSKIRTGKKNRKQKLKNLKGLEAMALSVIEKGQVDVHAKDESGNSAIALSIRSPKLVENLLQAGADPDGTDHKGDPLLIAAGLYAGGCKIMNALIDHGADYNITSPSGWTPLALAIAAQCLSTAEILLGKGVDIDQAVSVQPYAGDKYYSPVPIPFPGAPLHISKSPKLLEFLAESGANVNLAEKTNGYTPLHLAVFQNRSEKAHLLLGFGADPAIKDKSGKTPLDYQLEFQELHDARKKEALKQKRLAIHGSLSDGYAGSRGKRILQVLGSRAERQKTGEIADKKYAGDEEAAGDKVAGDDSSCLNGEIKHTAKCQKVLEFERKKMAGRCAREVYKYSPVCRELRKKQAIAAEKNMERECRQAVNQFTPECESFKRDKADKLERECKSGQQQNSSGCKNFIKQTQARLEKDCKTQKYRKTPECREFAREQFEKKIARCQQSGLKNAPECKALLNQKRASERQKCFIIKYQNTPACKDFFREADEKTNLYCSNKENRKKSACKNFGTGKFLDSREKAALRGCSNKSYENSPECKKFLSEIKKKVGKN